MGFDIHVGRCIFSQLKEDARRAAKKVGMGELDHEFDKPSPAIKSLVMKGEKAPLHESVPHDLGHQEMIRSNGLWASTRDDAS
jgi:hypothetical protein